MKYSIFYECKTDGKVFRGDFEIDSPDIPKHTDPKVIELALQDSTRFSQAGLGGIEVVSISPKDK